MAMEKPTLRERLIKDILQLPEEQLNEIDTIIRNYKESKIPYENEELSEEEKETLRKYDHKKYHYQEEFVNFDEIRRED